MSFATAPGRRGDAVAFGLGVLIASGQAPLSWPWVAVAAWAIAFALLFQPPDLNAADGRKTFGHETDRRVMAWRGWLLGLGHFSAALHWIVEPFLVDAARHGWMAPFALLLMAGGLALFWGGAFALSAWLAQGRRRVLLVVVLLTGAEMLRGVIFTGFPWASIGHVWIGWPQMQLASVAGAPGLTLLTLGAAALPALFTPRRTPPEGRWGARRWAAVGALMGAALLLAVGAWGHWRVPGPASLTGLTVRLIQPNAAQQAKWLPENAIRFFERQVEMTGAPAPDGGPRPDVVIWPETSVPWLLDLAQPALDRVAQAADGAQVALGMQRADTEGRWFNVLVRLDAAGQVAETYDKYHLVPFGEYMPLMHVFARMGIFGLAANETGGFTPGPGPQVIRFGVAGKVLPLICYEAIFPRDIARAPTRPDWLMQITNDAWFGKVSGPYQHLAQARLRAVEIGLPLVRAANTGVSAGFDPYGAELGRIPLGVEGSLDLPLPRPLPPTLYARWGDFWGLLVLGCIGSACVIRFRRRGVDGGDTGG